MRERNYTHEQAIHKSEERWKKESAEVTRLFYKAAVIENTILGDEDITTRKKKRETKRKENTTSKNGLLSLYRGYYKLVFPYEPWLSRDHLFRDWLYAVFICSSSSRPWRIPWKTHPWKRAIWILFRKRLKSQAPFIWTLRSLSWNGFSHLGVHTMWF